MSKLSFDQLTDLKLLLSVDGIGPAKIRKLLAKFRSIEKVLSGNLNSLREVVNENLSRRIQKVNNYRKKIESSLTKELETLSKINGKIITVWDDSFPSLLKKIYDPPLLLYTKGTFTKDDEYSIAIVGTRQPTNYGKIQTEKIASELANQNITIVSGLARGIDSIAHKSTLKTGKRTIAVIGSGLDVIYPPENKKLFDEISEQGLIISEYELGTKPNAENFPKRNRIISGFSH